MWWKIIIAVLYVIVILAFGRYLFIKRTYSVMEAKLCSLEEAKLITGDSYMLEWFLTPIVWPIFLIVYLIFNVVDKTYIKIYEKSRDKSS